ncbi:BglG family transcription antiterminator [Anoxybacillus flavithermus]|uniref:BglG family transcription antiterminator n=1 Tax=Anoxybacillus flavithermus TaxID=33934 RepID=UPI001867D329|nr:BglG family transcription antiterminator [Anoxybacillus flavithermus]MBE2943938.1 BglG family transcription antiterminator [Anoxybacillus flavithermus]MBE2952199.1 BglG family transcription antiterminator [Anoxybacillus flavithermus]MBE2954811.1 BglG family transcription antiterminator [Anoxybacillus flavithermus]MBE2960201.1 BglG family transcription antiterminator [Anoxybacillus flavithermus]
MSNTMPPSHFTNGVKVVTVVIARHKKIIKALLDANHYLSVTSLADDLRCSEKTIRNDLKVIDQWLQRYPTLKIERKPSVGVRLEGDNEEKETLFRDLLRMNDNEERQLQLLKCLLMADKPMTMQQLADRFYMSKTSIHDDLEEIDYWLRSFHLKLIRKPNLGLKVEGEEKNWRAALSKLVELFVDHAYYMLNEQQLKMVADVIQPYEVAFIEKAVQELEATLSFPLTDEAIISLTIHIAIAVKRMKQGYRIQMNPIQLEELQQKREYKLAEQLARKIEMWFAIKIPAAEVGYMTLHLLGARIRYDRVRLAKGVEQFFSQVDEEALQVTRLLIEHIANHIDARCMNDKELLLGLTIHLHSTFNRLRNGLSITNPMLREIKRTYRYSFEIVLSFMKQMEKIIKLNIPEDEIAYIVLHIQAAFERVKHKQHGRQKVLVVCATGAGTSRFVEAKLESVFPEIDVVGIASVSKLSESIGEKKPDLLISTVPLPMDIPVPVITVSPLLQDRELETIKDQLFRLRVQEPGGKSYEVLKSLLDERLIFLDLPFESRECVMNYLAEQLYQYGYVYEEYKQSVNERERLSSTYIGNDMAIPHGEVQFIRKSVIAVGRLQAPIVWGEDRVQLVFMIANRMQEKERIKQLFQELVALSEDEGTLKQLKQAKTVNQFYQCL